MNMRTTKIASFKILFWENLIKKCMEGSQWEIMPFIDQDSKEGFMYSNLIDCAYTQLEL